jgi:hypothetical protein
MFGRGIATKGSGTALKVLQKATTQNVTFKVKLIIKNLISPIVDPSGLQPYLPEVT